MYEIEELEKTKDRIDKTVYQYHLKGQSWTFLKLRQGCIAGEHYHKGLSPLKSPEVNVVLEGKIEYFFKDLQTGKIKKVIVSAPKLVKIKPFVYHELRVLEDSLLLEPFDENSAKDRFEYELS